MSTPDSEKIVCLVTLHGIGFEQPPEPSQPDKGIPGIPGYADDLHHHLSKCLGATVLGDDPGRNKHRKQPGESGPVYVQSWYPPGEETAKSGLVRLGDWKGADHRSIDATHAPLVNSKQRIAHVALVYSHLEGQGPLVGASFITLEMVAASFRNYGHLPKLAEMVVKDGVAAIQNQPHHNGNTQPATSLRIRRDPGFKPAGKHHHPTHRPPTGWQAILIQLENDVAAYVCRNEQREQIRYFVYEALLRLVCRDDVEAIVFNTHSNGTVIGLDAIRHLPPFAADKIKAFVTAGSPLRKYIDLFVWGQQIESLNPINGWINFWDPIDPVADPLGPLDWQYGDDVRPPYDPGLFKHVNPDTGKETTIKVFDKKVDNLANSKDTDLKAHNYWDNINEFVQPLAHILEDVAAGKEVSLSTPTSAQQDSLGQQLSA